ncbi:hypothetical protein BH18ACT4_BH18ACT4_15010 [soil metagenome]
MADDAGVRRWLVELRLERGTDGLWEVGGNVVEAGQPWDQSYSLASAAYAGPTAALTSQVRWVIQAMGLDNAPDKTHMGDLAALLQR